MSVWHDFIRRLEQDLAECRSDVELLESGRMQHRERRDGGAWVDTTQRELDWHKKTIGMYEGLVRKLRAEHGGGEPSCSWQSARAAHDSGCAIAALRPQRRRSGSPSRSCRLYARWAPGCRSATNASMATTFNAFTIATISHCNGVRRSDCERAVGPQRANPSKIQVITDGLN